MSDRPFADREPDKRRKGTVIDALVTDRNSMWALLSREEADTLELLFGDPFGCDEPIHICHEVRPDGVLIMGDVTVGHDALLSRMLDTEVSHRE